MKGSIFAILCAALLAASVSAYSAPRIVVVTDSQFSQAYGNATSKSLAFHQLQGEVNAIFHVLGSPGAATTTHSGYLGADAMIDALDFYIGRFGLTGMYVATGSNDFGQGVPLETYKTALRSLLSAASARGLGVTCFSPLNRLDMNIPNGQGLTLQAYRNAMQEVCSEYSYSTLQFNTVASDFADGLHLNHNGHTKFADWLANLGALLGVWTKY